MSDEEFDPTKSESEEEEEEEEVQERKIFAPPAQVAPTPAQQSEAQLAMQKRREQISSAGIDEHLQAMLDQNEKMRAGMEDEIQQLRAKSERRKAERQAEEARLAAMRAEEEARRKAEEKERQRKKEEEELKRREERAEKMAEFEKWKNPPRPNFIITKKALESQELSSTAGSGGAEAAQKSKEQAEAEKRAILGQRISPLSIEGMNLAALQEKAKELHQQIFRLEGDKYDLETRHKKGQYDMVELAERARQMSKGGKGKSVRVDSGDVDPIQERYSGAPPKISLCSKYERRKDKRSYSERHERFGGPQYLYPVDRIAPSKAVVWGDNGPEYVDDPNAKAQEQPPPPAPKPKPAAPPAEAPAEEQAAA